jgi:hypothetical protein
MDNAPKYQFKYITLFQAKSKLETNKFIYLIIRMTAKLEMKDANILVVVNGQNYKKLALVGLE